MSENARAHFDQAADHEASGGADRAGRSRLSRQRACRSGVLRVITGLSLLLAGLLMLLLAVVLSLRLM